MSDHNYVGKLDPVCDLDPGVVNTIISLDFRWREVPVLPGHSLVPVLWAGVEQSSDVLANVLNFWTRSRTGEDRQVEINLFNF